MAAVFASRLTEVQSLTECGTGCSSFMLALLTGTATALLMQLPSLRWILSVCRRGYNRTMPVNTYFAHLSYTFDVNLREEEIETCFIAIIYTLSPTVVSPNDLWNRILCCVVCIRRVKLNNNYWVRINRLL